MHCATRSLQNRRQFHHDNLARQTYKEQRNGRFMDGKTTPFKVIKPGLNLKNLKKTKNHKNLLNHEGEKPTDIYGKRMRNASPVLILKKPNGKGYRFVVDLRQVNRRSKPFAHYMSPTILDHPAWQLGTSCLLTRSFPSTFSGHDHSLLLWRTFNISHLPMY
eukprot:SAG11_NODE_1314_length_5223_cov_2.877244_6_plen_162_part_00